MNPEGWFHSPSQCFLNIFMDGCMRKMQRKVVKAGATLRLNGEAWSVVTFLFANDTVLLADSEGDLQRVVNEFCSVCRRRKLKVNAGESKVTVFERREEAVIVFQFPHQTVLSYHFRCSTG